MKHAVKNLGVLDRMVSRAESRNYIVIGPTPHDEQCTQAGTDEDAGILECNAYINQLIRIHGTPPEDAEFCIIENYHEQGIYHEVGITYTEAEDDWEQIGFDEGYDEDNVEEYEERENSPSEDYAHKCERGLDTWDDEARQELEEGKHPFHYVKIIQLKKSA